MKINGVRVMGPTELAIFHLAFGFRRGHAVVAQTPDSAYSPPEEPGRRQTLRRRDPQTATRDPVPRQTLRLREPQTARA